MVLLFILQLNNDLSCRILQSHEHGRLNTPAANIPSYHNSKCTYHFKCKTFLLKESHFHFLENSHIKCSLIESEVDFKNIDLVTYSDLVCTILGCF